MNSTSETGDEVSSPPIAQPNYIGTAVEALSSQAHGSFDYSYLVQRGFMLGLWYRSFPGYMLLHIQSAYSWDLSLIDQGNDPRYLYKYQFIADNGTSWHPAYRELRKHGWQRQKVWREGGRLQYLFNITDLAKPKGYQELWLLLDIQIATCKQVQVGTRMIEQPIIETQCEDLVELETQDEAEAGGFTPAVHLQYEGQADLIVEHEGKITVVDAVVNPKDDIPF